MFRYFHLTFRISNKDCLTLIFLTPSITRYVLKIYNMRVLIKIRERRWKFSFEKSAFYNTQVRWNLSKQIYFKSKYFKLFRNPFKNIIRINIIIIISNKNKGSITLLFSKVNIKILNTLKMRENRIVKINSFGRVV